MSEGNGDRLRIAFVVHDYNRVHGHSRYVAELATRLKGRHEVHVFANTFDEPEPDSLTFHHVPMWRPNVLAGILTFVLPATFAVRRRSFDIVHSQGLCGLRHDVATAHFILPGWYAALRQAKGSLTWRDRLTKALVQPLERHAIASSGVKRVIAISDRIRSDVDSYYGRNDGVRIVYHGVDLEGFHPRFRQAHREEVRRQFDIPLDAHVALFAGNLEKGAETAIRAAAKVPSLFLATASASDTSRYRELASELGVLDRMRFLPLSKEIRRYYAASDVFVFPTFYDAFGMVISEAMASGLPVVTCRRAGASELIRHGETGLLVDAPTDVDAVAECLCTLCADADLRRTMGEAARRAIESFSWDRAAEETLAVYREVIAEKAKP